MERNGSDLRLPFAVITILLMIIGWLWTEISTLQQDMRNKADRSEIANRWSSQQMAEYKAYVDARLGYLEKECGSRKDR